MYALERFNGVVKRFAHNRSQLDASIIQGYLTEECINFFTNFMSIDKPIGVPVSKHGCRLAGMDHKRGKKDIHVLWTNPPRSNDHN
jgi:hypothetical protein